MDVHPVNAAGNSLSELFPHQAAALESDDSSQEWLSVFVEDCFSGSSALASPVLGKTTPSVANQGARNPKLLPPSASNERRLRKRSFNSSANDDQQYTIPLFVEPPLLLIDQKHWMAESELILPKKDEDQELCHQQEQEYEEEKCGEDVLTEFHQGLLLKGYSDAFGLKIEPENRFSTISGMQFDQGTNKKKKKKEQGKQREKKKIKKTANDTERELPLGAPVKMCAHCMSSKTPQWRAGPLGPKTLCNACGVRYKSGRLLPEYRPANSPTFLSHIHSNSHKKVLQLRKAM